MMEKNPWIKDLLVAFAGTTLSIILTFGTSALIDHINRNKAFLRGEFAIPPLSLDSLYTLQSEMHLVDSLLNK